MSTFLAGTIPVMHDVDASGSFTINVPIQLPECRFKPAMALAYHSAATAVTVLGRGWAPKGASVIERVPATKAQDGFHGVVGYNDKDRFALDGQRLIKISETEGGKTEFRFEIEQWSRVFAIGASLDNPTSWEQWLPDGTIRKFGDTSDSKIFAFGSTTLIRVWAVSEASDPFNNYINFKYSTTEGAYYLDSISYGGNTSITDPDLPHQRFVVFEYETREDIITEYIGGYPIRTEKRLKSIQCKVKEDLKWTYELDYNYAPLTLISRLVSITLASNETPQTKVEPLKISWSDANDQVFDVIKGAGTLPVQGKISLVIPMDVDGGGRTDIVIASEVNTKPQEGEEQKVELNLDIFTSDSEGKLAATPTSGSGPTGLPPPKLLLPFDANGDGQSDLLYISLPKSDEYSLRILLSNGQGFSKEEEVAFKPKKMDGTFHFGDFKGDGHVGLIYLYLEAADEGKNQLKFVQLWTDGSKFIEGEVQAGPFATDDVKLESYKVVVGDFDGDGCDDVFIFSSLKGTNWMIFLIQSINGKLQYQSSDPLKPAGEAVKYVAESAVLPFRAGMDGKISLVIASKSDAEPGDNLQFQSLRSTGSTLVVDKEPTKTDVKYDGNIGITRILSQNSLDVVNFVKGDTGPSLHVFRFNGQNFKEVPNVRQPSGDVLKDAMIHWADLRGVGRTDCLFSNLVSDTKMIVRSLQCAGAEPLDRILSSTNGLGASTNVSYGPLSNPDLYTYTDTPYKQPTALGNSAANYMSFSALDSGSPPLQKPEVVRTDVIYFPTFVVRTISTDPGPTSSKFETFEYKYSDAKIDFDGRGWLGFKTISKTGKSTGVVEKTTFSQVFPLIGQVTALEKKDGNINLERMAYTWGSSFNEGNKNHSVFLRKVVEAYFESGSDDWGTYVDFSYDAYNNVTSTIIGSSEKNSGNLTIASVYQVPVISGSGRWIVGNKTSEDIQEGSTFLRRTKWDYFQGTSACEKSEEWISGDNWAMTTMTFDKAGNRTSITGPFLQGSQDKSCFYQELKYDPTYSTVVKTTTNTSKAGQPLEEKSSYDLATSLLYEVEKPTGLVTSFTYDVLGRKIKVVEGTSTDKKKFGVIEETTFKMDDKKLIEIRELDNGLAGDSSDKRKVITQYDGLLRPLSVRKSRPESLKAFTCVDTTYDALGRVSSRSKDYLLVLTPSPKFVEYSYDKRSRLIKETYPANKDGRKSVSRELTYSSASGAPVVTETLSAGGATVGSPKSVRAFSLIPNADTPSTGNFLKLCASKRTDEAGKTITTTFDYLGRPTIVKDQTGVQLNLSYDGLSRQTARRIERTTESGTEIFSHFTIDYEAEASLDSVNVNNVLTKSTIKTKSDYCQRTISKVTKDQTVTFFYDQDPLSKGKLSKVTSTKTTGGQMIATHAYAYDERGNRISTTIDLDDGRNLVTNYTWTASGQLLAVTNPDGSCITQTYFPDGSTVKETKLSIVDKTDKGNVKTVEKAKISFDDLVNEFGIPLMRHFGNDLSSKTSLTGSGLAKQDVLSDKEQNKVLDQAWLYDDFNKITSHTIEGLTNDSFAYNAAGQLSEYNSAKFTYDDSGNISSRGDFTFKYKGWQLDSVDGPITAQTSLAYKYTSDGKVLEKIFKEKDVADKMTSMEYDSEDRLVKLDGTTFLYDYAGHLLKATSSNGDSVIYASPTYEIEVPSATGAKETVTIYLTDLQRRASYTAETTESGTALDGKVYYYHQDQLGSTVAVSNSTGAIVTRYSYDVLGKVTVKGEDIARYKYCGKEPFAGSIYYFGSRFYDSETGRFLTLDNYPIDVDNISPSSFNLYLFSQNDPINYVDVNGNGPAPYWQWATDAFLVIAGVALTLASTAVGKFIGGVVGFAIGTLIGGALAPFIGIAVGAAVGIVLVGMLAGALFNAGVSGLLYNATSGDNNNTGDWAVQLTLGAVFGAVGSGLSTGISTTVSSFSRKYAIQATRNVYKHGYRKLTMAIAREGAVGAAVGAGQQVTTNALYGQAWDDGIGMSAFYGGLFGVVFPISASYAKGRISASAKRATSLLDTYSYPMRSTRTGASDIRLQLAVGRTSEPSIATLDDAYFGLSLPYIDA